MALDEQGRRLVEGYPGTCALDSAQMAVVTQRLNEAHLFPRWGFLACKMVDGDCQLTEIEVEVTSGPFIWSQKRLEYIGSYCTLDPALVRLVDSVMVPAYAACAPDQVYPGCPSGTSSSDAGDPISQTDRAWIQH